MNAQILRKWSPFKSLMYLWLIFLVLFSIIWCPGALAMHLTPVNLTKHQQSSQQQQRYISVDGGGVLNYSLSSSNSRSNKSNNNNNNSNNNKASRSELDQKLLTTHLHQITNNSHHNIQWMLSPASVSSPPLPLSSLPQQQQQPDSKRTNEIARWRHRMNEKRARIRAHRRTLLQSPETARNRRESLATTSLSTYNQQRALPLREREHKRYCSARDPAVLAFEAPTVFEGKIKSMSHNRQGPYSVTFECVHVYKQPAGFVIPPKVRLRFETTENRTECDIYRQEFKQRGPIRGDVLEQGKLYFLFVKQIDVGNFTILGQPIRKTKKTEKEVRLGASNSYEPPKSYNNIYVQSQRASIQSLTANVTVKEGKRIRLVCRVLGQPPPKVTWFKDDKSLSRLRKMGGVRGRREGIKLEQFKTRSRLIIDAASLSDAGKYECRAKNKVDRTFKSEFTYVRVLPNSTTTTSTTIKSATTPQPCPSDYQDELCLNGGECVYFPSIDEKSCSCRNGFSGDRCQNKEPGSHQASTYTSSNNKKECKSGYIGGYYC